MAAKPSNIVYDDTPIHVYMARIHARLLERGQLAFSELFDAGHAQVGAGGHVPGRAGAGAAPPVRVEQNELFGEIWLLPEPELRRAAGPFRRRQLRARRECCR